MQHTCAAVIEDCHAEQDRVAGHDTGEDVSVVEIEERIERRTGERQQ